VRLLRRVGLSLLRAAGGTPRARPLLLLRARRYHHLRGAAGRLRLPSNLHPAARCTTYPPHRTAARHALIFRHAHAHYITVTVKVYFSKDLRYSTLLQMQMHWQMQHCWTTVSMRADAKPRYACGVRQLLKVQFLKLKANFPGSFLNGFHF
jgi:hypothetical protein